VHELTTQLETAIFLIEKITTKRGIASAAYRKGLKCVKNNMYLFMKRVLDDDLFLTKFCYYLDMAQHSLFSKLLDCCSNKNPLLKAKKKKMSGLIDERIENFVTPMEKGVVLNIVIPSSLSLTNRDLDLKSTKRGKPTVRTRTRHLAIPQFGTGSLRVTDTGRQNDLRLL